MPSPVESLDERHVQREPARLLHFGGEAKWRIDGSVFGQLAVACDAGNARRPSTLTRRIFRIPVAKAEVQSGRCHAALAWIQGAEQTIRPGP